MIVARGLGKGGSQIQVTSGLGRRVQRQIPLPGGGFRSRLRPRAGLTLREQIIEEDDLLLLLAVSLISAPH